MIWVARDMPHIEDTAVTAILLLGERRDPPKLPMMPRFTILLAEGSCRHLQRMLTPF